KLHLHGGQAVSRTNKCHQNMHAPVPTGTVSLVAVLPTPVRNDGVSRHRTPAGDVAYAAIPNMVPVYEAQRSHRQASQSSGVLQMQESPGEHSVAARGGDHRRFHQRLGSCLRRERCERSLVCDRGRVSHKCVRAANSSPSSTTLSAQAEWSACTSEDGQHCDLGVYKSPGRSASLYHWATRLLLWAARHVLSLRAVHIPGHLNYGADLLSRGDPQAADWCLHPHVIEQDPQSVVAR